MKIRLICFTQAGRETGEKVCKGLNEKGHDAVLDQKGRFMSSSIKESSQEWAARYFCSADALVFVSSCGIAVRAIAPQVHDKLNAAFLNHGAVITKYTGARGKSGTSDANAEFLSKIRAALDEDGVCWQIGEMGKVDEGGDANLQINGKLMNDIDMLGIENLHLPIGVNTGKKYNGTFDGQGFRIKNMIIERPSDSNIGFFGFLRGNAANTTVKNLIIDKSCTIHGYNRVGGITGSCQNNGALITLENIINEATVIAEHQDAAGIIGGQEGNEERGSLCRRTLLLPGWQRRERH